MFVQFHQSTIPTVHKDHDIWHNSDTDTLYLSVDGAWHILSSELRERMISNSAHHMGDVAALEAMNFGKRLQKLQDNELVQHHLEKLLMVMKLVEESNNGR